MLDEIILDPNSISVLTSLGRFSGLVIMSNYLLF